MSFTQLRTPGRELALASSTLTQAQNYFERIKTLGLMYPCFKSPTFQFTVQALTMLEQLCDFDTRQVLHEIASLASNPCPSEAIIDPCNGFRRLWRCKYPFRNYHYLIKFSRTGNDGIIVEDVLFDENRTGLGVPQSLQRSLLYHVQSRGDHRYRDVKTAKDAEKLSLAWDKSKPTPAICTRHAAVNGMQNNLAKAQWLMGTHLDVAYPEANLKEYTLFHNPTDGIALSDIAECLWDKVAPLPFMASCQVQHLADLLWQRQTQGEQTDWVVHSQGAIIFKAAVRHHLRVRTGSPLDRHAVAFHAGGSVLASTKPYLQQAGIKIGLERINPYDLVPNLAGHNDASPSGLLRALCFMRNVFSDNDDNPSISPHTLPFLGIRTYYLQLKTGGHHRDAATVANFMEKISYGQILQDQKLNDPNAKAFPLPLAPKQFRT